MTHLDTVVRMLPCDQYVLVNFDWIADEPKVGKMFPLITSTKNVLRTSVLGLCFDLVPLDFTGFNP